MSAPFAPSSSGSRAQPSAGVLGRSGPDGFEVIELVGQGTFSEVWRIRQTASGTPFALKRLRHDWQDDPTARQLFRNEAEVCRTVCSRHVARAVQSGQWRGSPYVIFEWLEGTRLEEILNVRGKLPACEAAWIARQCAVGLADLERAGFSHGDVKPQNIVVTSAGRATLVDLGFARPVHAAWLREGMDALTGTPEYMAPECLSTEQARPVMKDMYSLGVVLFRMLTGRLPFVADTPADVLKKQRSVRPPLLRLWCPEAPRPLADLIGRLLAKQPIRRPASLSALIGELIRIEVSLMPERFVI